MSSLPVLSASSPTGTSRSLHNPNRRPSASSSTPAPLVSPHSDPLLLESRAAWKNANKVVYKDIPRLAKRISIQFQTTGVVVLNGRAVEGAGITASPSVPVIRIDEISNVLVPKSDLPIPTQTDFPKILIDGKENSEKTENPTEEKSQKSEENPIENSNLSGNLTVPSDGAPIIDSPRSLKIPEFHAAEPSQTREDEDTRNPTEHTLTEHSSQENITIHSNSPSPSPTSESAASAPSIPPPSEISPPPTSTDSAPQSSDAPPAEADAPKESSPSPSPSSSPPPESEPVESSESLPPESSSPVLKNRRSSLTGHEISETKLPVVTSFDAVETIVMTIAGKLESPDAQQKLRKAFQTAREDDRNLKEGADLEGLLKEIFISAEGGESGRTFAVLRCIHQSILFPSIYHLKMKIYPSVGQMKDCRREDGWTVKIFLGDAIAITHQRWEQSMNAEDDSNHFECQWEVRFSFDKQMENMRAVMLKIQELKFNPKMNSEKKAEIAQILQGSGFIV